MLIGQGFDAHRFAPAGSGRELWIAGLYWPVPDSCSEADAAKYEGIEGDSDGDVAAHALIDALLAAARLGDIGSLFGVGADAHGAGRHGIDMLQEVVAHLASNGYTPASASVAIIGNRPKIGTRRAEAKPPCLRRLVARYRLPPPPPTIWDSLAAAKASPPSPMPWWRRYNKAPAVNLPAGARKMNEITSALSPRPWR